MVTNQLSLLTTFLILGYSSSMVASHRFSSFLYLFFSMNRMKWAAWRGVKIDLIPSIMSYSSMLFSSISFFMSFRSWISASSKYFCSFKNYRFDWISFFCYSDRLRAFFSSKNHSSSLESF